MALCHQNLLMPLAGRVARWKDKRFRQVSRFHLAFYWAPVAVNISMLLTPLAQRTLTAHLLGVPSGHNFQPRAPRGSLIPGWISGALLHPMAKCSGDTGETVRSQMLQKPLSGGGEAVLALPYSSVLPYAPSCFLTVPSQRLTRHT